MRPASAGAAKASIVATTNTRKRSNLSIGRIMSAFPEVSGRWAAVGAMVKAPCGPDQKFYAICNRPKLDAVISRDVQFGGRWQIAAGHSTLPGGRTRDDRRKNPANCRFPGIS
jgi:hypothetical protein